MTALAPLLRPSDVADLLGVSEKTLERWRGNPDHPLVWIRVSGKAALDKTHYTDDFSTRLETLFDGVSSE